MELSPFVKWAGGKTQLLPEILKRVPKEFNNYYEPFIGGGTVLLALQPNNATINDINSELIHVYKTIVDEPLKLIQFIYRSAIRDGKPIIVYVPSKRMRELLKDWINKKDE